MRRLAARLILTSVTVVGTVVLAQATTPGAHAVHLGAAAGETPGAVEMRPPAAAGGATTVADLFEPAAKGQLTAPAIEGAQTGARFKVRGRWTGTHLTAERVQPRDALKDPTKGLAAGRITAVGPEPYTLHLGPLAIVWNPTTDLRSLTAGDLKVGTGIEVSGRFDAGRLVADSIAPATTRGDRIELIGAVTAQTIEPDGTSTLTILGVPVRITPAIAARDSTLVRTLDDRRPDDQLTVSVLRRPLTIGGEVGTQTRYRRDLDLDSDEPGDAARVEVELQIELLYRIADKTLLFLEGKVRAENEFFREEGQYRSLYSVARGESWLYLGDLGGSGVSLQMGRQNFRESREWWWDRDLDALRLLYDRPLLHLELAGARELFPVETDPGFIEPEFEGVWRVLGNAAWAWAPRQRLDAFLAYQRDDSAQPHVGSLVPEEREDNSDANLVWLGARSSGQLADDTLGKLTYWLDGAWVTGSERRFKLKGVDPQDPDADSACGPTQQSNVSCVEKQNRRWVSGFGFDLGATWVTRLAARPAFTLAYAIGSGDDHDGSGTDHAFRQTGLQRNNDRFSGVDRFRYYGELLRPELSNLHITTAAVGFRFFEESSVTLVHHLYWQVQPTDSLRDAELDIDPNDEEGRSPRSFLGQEIDLVIGLEEWEHWEVEAIGAVFHAGAAFGSRSGSFAEGVFVKVDYNF